MGVSEAEGPKAVEALAVCLAAAEAPLRVAAQRQGLMVLRRAIGGTCVQLAGTAAGPISGEWRGAV